MKTIARWGMIGLLVAGASGVFAETPCASTPGEAVRAYERGQPVAGIALEGYRVASWYSDLALGVNWAQVERCLHPDWPELSVRMMQRPERAATQQTAHAVTPVGQAAPLAVNTVRVGEAVRLWRNEPNLRMEMPAVSEESGRIGERVRLRIVSEQENVQVVRYVFGLVRGPADVEME